MNYKNESGQTIIEAVVALAAIFLIVGAISIAILNALNNSQFVKSQNLANKYAQQAMEHVRRVQSEDIKTFEKDLVGTYSYGEDVSTCPDTDTRGFCPGATSTVNVGGTHMRNVNFENDADPCRDTGVGGGDIGLKKVTVIVSWSSGQCPEGNTFCHNSTLVSCIPYEGRPNALP